MNGNIVHSFLPAPVMQVKVAPQRRKSSLTIVEVSWHNLCYTVKRYGFPKDLVMRGEKDRFRTILNGVSGSFRSGQLVALMGPSGAGKSTLLECIGGKRTIGLSGDIRVGGKDSLRVGFVEQFDHLLDHLTVRESLIFASRLRNADRPWVKHDHIADNLIRKLGLEICQNNLALKCSGGQRKRLSIALELVSKVDVLILDEPTTGLDSSATSQTIKAALSLTKQRKPIAIVATIHQPSSKMFALFDKVYVLSKNGKCVYDGPPQEVAQTLSLVGLSVPKFYNPADFIIEVASGEVAKQCLHQLSHYANESYKARFENKPSEGESTIITAIQTDRSKRSKSTFKKILILIQRIFLITCRDPNLFLLRVLSVFPTAFVLGLIFSDHIGKASGCPPSKLMLWKSDVNELMDQFQEDRFSLQENVSLLFLTMMMCMFGTYSAIILTFPFEMSVFVKEYSNSYYSIFSYYVSKVVADIPFCMLTSFSLTTLVFYITGQVLDTYDRLIYINIINFLVTLHGQTIGLIFGALFLEDANAATFASGIVVLPLFIFSGFFRKISLMPSYLVAISYVSFLRYALGGTLITFWGLNRCEYEHMIAEAGQSLANMTRPQWLKAISAMLQYQSFMGEKDEEDIISDTPEKEPEDEIMLMFGGKESVGNKTVSILLTMFEINGSYDSYWLEVQLLAVGLVIMHVLIYAVLLWKVGRKH